MDSLVEDQAARLVAARKRAMMHLPEIAPFLFLVPTRVVPAAGMPPSLATAYVSTKEMVFAAEFIAGLDDPHLCGLVLHEACHLMLRHLSHPWVDQRLPHAAFLQLRNTAQDIVIENFIHDWGVMTAANGLQFIEQNFPFEMIKEFAGLGWREVYEKLLAAGDKFIGQALLDVHIYGSDDPEELAKLEALLKRAQAESENIKAERAARGLQSCGLEFEVDEACAKLDWRDALRDCLTDMPAKIRRSWSSVNRRAFSRGQLRPTKCGTVSSLDKIYLLVDTSGSMQDELADVAADIKELLARVGVTQVRYANYDAELTHYEVVSPGDVQFNPRKFRGGGGTSVIRALHTLMKRGDYDDDIPMVVITDGEDDFDLPPDVLEGLNHVVWVTYGRRLTPTIGRVVCVSD